MSPAAVHVQRLHQILLWPLRLMPVGDSPGAPRRPWELLHGPGHDCPWREVQDEYTGEPGAFHERHYQEFVTFLPYVQRVLYGEGRSGQGAGDALGESGMKVFRRHDIRALRAWLRPEDAPLRLELVHVDLYFFFDVDVVMLNVELAATDLPLQQVQELLYRLGRAYPSGWDAQGQPLHCLAAAEWLGEGDVVLARSDTRERERFISHVQAHRAPRIAAHWDFVLRPLVSEHGEASGQAGQAGHEGLLRYRQIEYYRMPVMAYLALDDPGALSRSDFVRLGLVAGAGEGGLPYGEQHLQDFEQRYCYDRFWAAGGAAPHTRYLCCGHALVVLGRADAAFYACRDRGVLAQFRHQHFLIFLLAHFQKAALLMFSDRLVEALRRLNVQDPDNVRRFKRAIRSCFEGFLRFTHRYWFHEVAEQAQARALFRLCARHLETDALYTEVKERIGDMSAYLETDSIRRQANTVVRLTVVTIFGLVGTITTGFLGMNLLAEADAPLLERLGWFMLTLGVTIALTVYTMVKSKRLSDFLDALSDERLSLRHKLLAFAAVWRRGSDQGL
ncbi:hypothetical protein PFX98_03905 [Paucibacter sediminis]|uniref:CorA-like Mg2+ transporter protein n=1 Tax=Paucibacter sediminis TaxID=3019553 RepID=A0AA95SXE0_9BURK|nr:hypothetical protein [Paucibacter sp. S2-9]WIT12769.1 hypothetical protein PFX98_03905 [Paucibacter sp. S2-9]